MTYDVKTGKIDKEGSEKAVQKAFGFVKKHPISILFATLTLYLMWLIFSFSAQVGEASSEVSDGVCRFLAELFVSGFSDLTDLEKELKIEALVPLIRKGAHFCVFASLGFCSSISIFSFKLENGFDFSKKSILYPTIFCFVYAASDEFHQLFVEGRNGNVRDVLIDFCGAILGILVAIGFYMLFVYLRQRNRKEIKKYQK